MYIPLWFLGVLFCICFCTFCTRETLKDLIRGLGTAILIVLYAAFIWWFIKWGKDTEAAHVASWVTLVLGLVALIWANWAEKYHPEWFKKTAKDKDASD